MSGKVINFKDKKINKKDFYNNKKQFKIKDIDINKILISKPESYGNKNAKKTLLDIVMTLLDQYAYFSLKRMVMLNVLMIIRQCLFLLMIRPLN